VDYDEDEAKSLSWFLLAFSFLKTLTLSFRGCYGYLLVETLSNSAKWRNLSSLELHRIVTTEQDFLRFLKAHTRSLRHLNLQAVAFDRGHWVPILHALGVDFMLESTDFDILCEYEHNMVWYGKSVDSKWTLRSALIGYIFSGRTNVFQYQCWVKEEIWLKHGRTWMTGLLCTKQQSLYATRCLVCT
jgi:hypothetical protein